MEGNSNTKDELREEAPLLHGLKKENPFMVEDSYFEGLPTEIQERVLQTGRKRFRLFRGDSLFLRPRVYIPAGVACLFILITVIRNISQPKVDAPALTAENITEFVIQSETDETLIEEVYTNAPKTELGRQSSDPSVEDYLINENADISNYLNTL